MMYWVWLWLALLGIIIGAVLLGLADQSKPKTTYERSSYGSRYSYAKETGDQGTYSTMVAIGVIFLLAGELLPKHHVYSTVLFGTVSAGTDSYCHWQCGTTGC
jgi:hypothetical protein